MPLRLLVAAVLLIAATGLGWIAYKATNPTAIVAQETPVTQVRVLVATQPLQAGTLLKDTDLRQRDVPASEVPEGSFAASDDAIAEIRGAMLRRYLDAGAVMLRRDVLRPRDRGFLAAVLTPGARAISIGVDAKTGASGLISPGDLVDVILSQEFQGGDTPVGRRVVAETVLTSIRVIAVDQQIAQGAPASAPAPSGLGGASRVASTVTLQVTPEQAERITVAQRLGQLVLSVRPIDAADDAAPAQPVAVAVGGPAAPPRPGHSGVVFGADVSSALARDEPISASPQRIRVIEGGSASDVVFR